jgi:hypothetical protein
VLYPELFLNSSIMYNRGRNDLYFWGIKRPQYTPRSKEIYEVLKNAK